MSTGWDLDTPDIVGRADGDVRIDCNNNTSPPESASIIFSSTNETNEMMRIKNDGKVGIGIADPLECLHVNGNIRLGDITSPPSFDNRVWTTEKVFNVLDYGAETISGQKTYGTEGEITSSTRIEELGAFSSVLANDTLLILNGQDIGIYTITSADANSATVNGASWHVTSPPENIHWMVLAGTPVDCTTAFQAAIDDAESTGGGVVFVPTGYYFFGTSTASPAPESTLIIKSNVILRGMRSKPANWSQSKWFPISGSPGTEFEMQGPVLLPTDTNIPFITLQRSMKNACIEGLTIFYPLQGIVSGSGTTDPQIVEYPACIIMGDLEEYQDESTVNSDNSVRNMLLVNPYIGIYCRTYIEVEIGSPPGPTSPPTEQGIGRVYLSNIHGCPLQNGIIVDGLWDVTYIERINFSPYFLYEDYSDANQERKDWNTYVLRNCTAIHIKFAVWSILNDVFALTAHRGLVLDHNNQTAEGFDGAVDIMGTNIQFDQCDVCIEVVAGEAYLTNVRLTGGLNYKVRDYYANDYNLCSEKKAILTSGDPASVLTIINGSITCFDEPLSSPPPNPQCVVWEKAGILNIQNVLFVDNNIVEISCGVYMSDGRLTLSNCRFQNNNSGFTKAFEITGNVESAIISGNDYQGIDPGINYAQDRNFTVDGALLLHQTVGEIGLSLEGNAQGNTPFLTWKGQPEETSPPTAETAADSYSIRYSNSDLKLSMGYGNNDIGYTSQITIDQPTGNLGIGTTTPSEKLTVQDTNTSLRIGDGIGNAGNPEPQIKSPGALLIGVDSEVNGSEFIRLTYEDGRNWLQSFEADTTVSPPAPKAAALTLAAGTSRGIEIDTSGNVGIGTATPTQALDVEGRITVHPTGTTPDNNYNGNLVITKPASSGQYLNFVRYGNFVWSMGMVYGTNKFAIAPGDSTDADFPTAATSLVIDGAGAVGIGTDTPTSKLTLAGGDFLVDNGGSNRYLVHTQKTYNYGLYFDYSAESLAVVTHSTPRLTVDDGGNVGIGTTSPGSGLHIGVDAGGTDKGYITLEQLTTTPSAPGTGKSIIYMRNGYLCTRVGTGNEVILA